MKAIILHQKHAAWHVYSLWPWIQKPFNSWVCVCVHLILKKYSNYKKFEDRI